MLKMTIDNEEVLSNNDISIKEEILSPSSTILNNVYPKSWEQDKDYVSRFYYPKDYSKLNIQNFSVEPEEAGTTIDINGNATLNDVDTTKESRVLRLLGQTSQVSYSGYNLLPISSLATQTKNGVTFTNNNDGSYTFNGTASGYTAFSLFDNLSFNGNYTYYLKDTATAGFEMYLQNSNGGGVGSTTSHNTINNNTARMIIGINSGVTLSNLTIRPYVYSGNYDSNKPYEPYTGGIPSPNPNYPQDIHVVSGDNEINICGKNLFDGVFRQGNISTLSNMTRVFSTQNLYLESGKSYTISTNLNTSLYKYAIALSDTTYPVPSGFYDSGWKTTSSFTFTPSRSGYFGLGIAKSNGTDNITPNDILNFNWQLEKGSTATTYEPYIGNTYPLYLGVENLVDSNINIERTLASYGNVNATTNTACTLKAGTYTLSFDMKSDSDTGRHLNKINLFNASTLIKAINYYKIATTQYERQSIELTLDSEITFNTFAIQVAEAGTYYFKDFQIEAGSKANSYSEYGTTPIELCKIGDYQDYIYKDNGSWYLHKEIGKVVLDGTESGWSYDSTYKYFRTNTYDFGNQIPMTGFSGMIQYSNYFTLISTWSTFRDSTTTNSFYWVQNSGYKLCFRNTAYTTTSDFTTWLSNNKPIVYYILATPTNTLIEDTTLIEQLEALSS